MRTATPMSAGRARSTGPVPSDRSKPRGTAGIEGNDQLLTVAQAGDYLCTGERFVRRLITQRRITYVKLGKYVRLERSALDAFIEAGRVVNQP